MKSIEIKKSIGLHIWSDIIEGYIDSEYFLLDLQRTQLLQAELQELEYTDMRLLGGVCKERNAKEDKRDFSFITLENNKIYIEHIPSKKVYSVEYVYKATFQTDRFEIRNINRESYETINKSKNDNRETAMMNIYEYDLERSFNMFITSLEEDEEYEYATYSYYLSLFDKNDEYDDEYDDEYECEYPYNNESWYDF